MDWNCNFYAKEIDCLVEIFENLQCQEKVNKIFSANLKYVYKYIRKKHTYTECVYIHFGFVHT